ncbi:MAG TPA: leucine--tRNA ligase, partial [Ignavibacteria bacterium]|nr:leucine--tRNA ligase [Ignavibacteria bacterium]
HLFYARFIHKFLRDIGYTKSNEPFLTLVHQGTITNQGVKMSKSKGNIVNPNDFTGKFGSDVFRLYLMFMGPYEMGSDWSDKGITGTDRFVQRTYELFNKFSGISKETVAKEKYDIRLLQEKEKSVYRKVNRTIKKFDEDINNFRFNTAVASLMELLNELTKNLENCSKQIQVFALERFAILLAPVAPHLGEECNEIMGMDKSLFIDPVWFNFDPAALVENSVNIAVQVNGKLRTTINMPINSRQDKVKTDVFKDVKVLRYIDGKNIIKEIYVKDKIYNIVVK